MTQEIPVTIRVMPSADELEISIPSSATPRELINHILDADVGVPKLDAQSNQVVYQLIPKGKNAVLKETETFSDGDVQANDVILMIPKVIAG